jgi:uncharacterized protein (UPF0548 family)
MDWLWFGASADLSSWEKRRFSDGVEAGPRPGDKRDNHERVLGLEIPGPPADDGIARRAADAILRFDVFPPSVLSGVMPHTVAEVGDAIGLRYPFAPGLRLFFAARVIERFEDTTATLWRCGFTYRTLDGHPACGEETFIVEKELATGKVTAALRSWSRPDTLLARAAYPLMRLLQVRAARAALDHLERRAAAGDSGFCEPVQRRRPLRTSLFW